MILSLNIVVICNMSNQGKYSVLSETVSLVLFGGKGGTVFFTTLQQINKQFNLTCNA
ncbi:hypothetical protein THOB06_60023 [Vibrio rotiferianus]|nr:hypothetical protein THOG10_60023 [Vibrio rotiferianus]CAH1592912.1 hypothetical protein THOB06_60023 [Vibrio rotiferianus]